MPCESTATLFDIWTKLYPRERIRRQGQIETKLRQIERLMGRPPIAEIDDAWLERLRDSSLESGLSARTTRYLMRQVTRSSGSLSAC